MMTIRPEREEDHAAIDEVNRGAFGRENEARLVENLRRSSTFIPELSLVAVKDVSVVGHLLFSPIAIQMGNSNLPALALAPVAVRPEYQNQGIGSQLVRHGLRQCRDLGHKVIVVVGHPEYYPRFGFSSARAKGLEAPFPVPDEAFLILELVPGTLEGIKGVVNYPSEFDDV
ncbi:MAG: GNAT family N-acetyltransferase [Deltaproteobacteria bacterium RBG_13_52_11b]|nr:MAG: GNAT family N-acetyltransferase [Deltaproteobacteria bacterium RBG_13_52_11b]